MTENNKTAILLGASGLIGGFLLDMLLNSDTYKSVKIFVRKSLNRTHTKLTEYIIDFEQPETYKHLVIGNDLFCCLGTTIRKAGSQASFRKVDYEYPLTFAEIGKENGLDQFLIVSSIGANANSSVFYTRTKGECENAIKSLEIKSVNIFRPSVLLGDRKEYRIAEKLSSSVMTMFSALLIGKWKKYRPIAASQVAKAMLFVAEQSTEGITVYESNKIQSI